MFTNQLMIICAPICSCHKTTLTQHFTSWGACTDANYTAKWILFQFCKMISDTFGGSFCLVALPMPQGSSIAVTMTFTSLLTRLDWCTRFVQLMSKFTQNCVNKWSHYKFNICLNFISRNLINVHKTWKIWKTAKSINNP